MSHRGILRRPGSARSSRVRSRSPFLGRPARVRKYYDYKGKLNRGESLAISEVPYKFWEFGRVYQITGDYWGSQCTVTGRLEMISIGPGGDQAHVLLKGTDNPELRQWAENAIMSHNVPEITVHLCPANCPKTSLSRGSMHGTAVQTEDTRASWAGNVEIIQTPTVPGGIGDLERELQMIGEKGKQNETEEVEVPKIDSKRNAKSGDTGYKGTPLDGKISIRQLLKRRSKKKKKSKKSKKSKKRKHSHSGSSRSGSQSTGHGSSSSGGSINSEDSGHPFREGHRIKQLGKRIPGILMRHSLEEMNRLLVQHLGEESADVIRPTLLRYLRLHVMSKNVAPAQKRELLTLGYSIDQLLQRNILGALDIMIQRVKAIELVLNGATWSVAQNIELVPLEQEIIASVAEAQGAAREFRHENRVQREVAGKGPGKWRWTAEDGKGKKGDGKKGDGKGGKWGGKRDQVQSSAARADPTKPQ